MLTLHNATVVTPTDVIPRGAVVVGADGRIDFVGSAAHALAASGECLDLQGSHLLPGFIDVHTHGGNGITFGQLGRIRADMREYSRWVTAGGVTGFLCSVAAPDAATLLQVVAETASALHEGLPGAVGLGMHLEGPFLNPVRKGAFDPHWLHHPTTQEVEALLAAGQGWIRQVTLAPELPGAQPVAAMLRAAGVVASLGHSDLSYELASAALRADWTHVTHTFNAQRGFAHREPGVIGAVLASDAITAELIADGMHVHPAAMKVLLRCIGAERVVLVTDSLAAAGLADGNYELVGSMVTVKHGRATLQDGTLAGSTATLNQCVRNVMVATGVPLADAVRMASLNPAQAMGLANRVGSIAVGKEANLAVVDTLLNVHLAVVRGRIVYRGAAA